MSERDLSPKPANFPPGFASPLTPTGIALRDYFAGQALAGILARPEYEGAPVSAVAYAYADAMITERDK